MEVSENIQAIRRLFAEFQGALDNEIVTARSMRAESASLRNGISQGTRNLFHLYSFTSELQLRFPDDTPVDVECNDEHIEGFILAIEGSEVVLALQRPLPRPIPKLKLFTKPWFLLKELKSRLTNFANCPTTDYSLLQHLLTRTPYSSAHQSNGQGNDQIAVDLDEHQLAAVRSIMTLPVTFIWGPPGTGKTHTLAATVEALHRRGETVLVVAHSNVAVDMAMLGIGRRLANSSALRSGRILRYGTHYLEDLTQFETMHVRGLVQQENPKLVKAIEKLESRRRRLLTQARNSQQTDLPLSDKLQKLQSQLKSLREELRQKEKALLSNAVIVGCTLSKVTIERAIFSKQFDAVLVDEGSMAYIPHCALAALLARHRIAVFGDFRQLAPICQSRAQNVQRWLGRDIFDEAGVIERVNTGENDDRLRLLAMQYRMHPDIAAIPNKLFYSNLLENAPNVEAQRTPLADCPPVPGRALGLIDLTGVRADCYRPGKSGSRFNLISAIMAVRSAQEAHRRSDALIGIITPYRAQSRLIRSMLIELGLDQENVRVDTVHRFQGGERDVIIFDMVDSSPQRSASRLLRGGLGTTAMRLMNVAITRARSKFVMLVDRTFVQQRLNANDSVLSLLAHTCAGGEVQTPNTLEEAGFISGEESPQGVHFFGGSSTAKDFVESRLASASTDIAISWPVDIAALPFQKEAIEAADSRGVFVYLSEQEQKLGFALGNSRLCQRQVASRWGVVGIGHEELWIYLDPRTENSPVLCLTLPATVNILYDYFQLADAKNEEAADTEQPLDLRKGPVGRLCPHCGQPLEPRGRNGGYLRCPRPSCEHTQRMLPEDATYLARYMELKCERCGSPAVGRQSKRKRSVFIGCQNYPKCKWTLPIKNALTQLRIR